MLDSLEEEELREEQEEERSPSEKKRRLTLHQVKALEKNFELDNKLEPVKKLKLAEELGLQPRQIAIWFQNRRARWKTKRLERDYGSLKASYDALQLDYNSLEQQKEALTQKLKELKSKVGEEISADSSSQSAKEDVTASGYENNASAQSQQHHHHLDFSNENEADWIVKTHSNTTSPVVNWIQSSDSRAILGDGFQTYQPHLIKTEDHGIFSAEDSYNFFSVDHAPTLP